VCYEADNHIPDLLSPYKAAAPTTQDIREMMTRIVQETLGRDP
jgi:hypothetical protein